jgi:hypothetical protein
MGRADRKPGRILCPRCDAKVVVFDEHSITLFGTLTVEISTRPADSSALVVCYNCGCLVPIEHRLLLIH